VSSWLGLTVAVGGQERTEQEWRALLVRSTAAPRLQWQFWLPLSL